MNIKDDYQPQEDMNALQAMQGCMAHLAEELILPNAENFTDEQKYSLGIIGATLQTIAEKAYAFERIQNGKQNENSRN